MRRPGYLRNHRSNLGAPLPALPSPIPGPIMPPMPGPIMPPMGLPSPPSPSPAPASLPPTVVYAYTQPQPYPYYGYPMAPISVFEREFPNRPKKQEKSQPKLQKKGLLEVIVEWFAQPDAK